VRQRGTKFTAGQTLEPDVIDLFALVDGKVKFDKASTRIMLKRHPSQQPYKNDRYTFCGEAGGLAFLFTP